VLEVPEESSVSLLVDGADDAARLRRCCMKRSPMLCLPFFWDAMMDMRDGGGGGAERWLDGQTKCLMWNESNDRWKIQSFSYL
jgi:hypothetical protein